MVKQMLGGLVFELVGGGVQESGLYQQRRIVEQTQQLGFCLQPGGHQVQDGDAQGTDALIFGMRLSHEEDIFAFKDSAHR